jgi:hypothetical protein
MAGRALVPLDQVEHLVDRVRLVRVRADLVDRVLAVDLVVLAVDLVVLAVGLVVPVEVQVDLAVGRVLAVADVRPAAAVVVDVAVRMISSQE